MGYPSETRVKPERNDKMEKSETVEALLCCAIPLVMFGVMSLFGLKPKERRTIDVRLEEDHEYSHKEGVS